MNKTGFTLLELICTLLIFSILCTIAFPSYQAFICKTRRAEAKTALLNLAIIMENNYTKNHTYEQINRETNPNSTVRPRERWYQLVITEQTKNSFMLKAIPLHAQANDKQCQTLTLNSTNIKGIESGPGGEPIGKPEDCW